jgi:hypothetical protein
MSFKVEKEEKIAFSICFKDFTRETVRRGRKILKVRKAFRFDWLLK